MEANTPESADSLDLELAAMLADEPKPLTTPVRVSLRIGDAEYAVLLELPAHYPLNYQEEHAAVAQDAMGIGNGIAGAFYQHFFPAGEGGEIVADDEELADAGELEAGE